MRLSRTVTHGTVAILPDAPSELWSIRHLFARTGVRGAAGTSGTTGPFRLTVRHPAARALRRAVLLIVRRCPGIRGPAVPGSAGPVTRTDEARSARASSVDDPSTGARRPVGEQSADRWRSADEQSVNVQSVNDPSLPAAER
ncbi:hypothetical protein GCM10010495_32610 [Kitasatospora herbaricolor]|nr:hypothetical protein GCM10010495_32610 [Kitasatospora herbaricolor]